MNNMERLFLNILIFSTLLLSSTFAWSTDIDTIIAQKQAPPGVVFEIVSDESGLLSTLLPTVKNDIEKLRKRFPKLPVAIVTHGTEQFALTIKNKTKESKAHALVEKLVNSSDVDVHVCGTHAEWYGLTPEDFPDYVDVTAAGPAQINDYEAMGYELIILSE